MTKAQKHITQIALQPLQRNVLEAPRYKQLILHLKAAEPLVVFLFIQKIAHQQLIKIVPQVEHLHKLDLIKI